MTASNIGMGNAAVELLPVIQLCVDFFQSFDNHPWPRDQQKGNVDDSLLSAVIAT